MRPATTYLNLTLIHYTYYADNINIHFTHSDLEPANSSVTCIDKNPLELHVYNYVSAPSVEALLCSVLQLNSYV